MTFVGEFSLENGFAFGGQTRDVIANELFQVRFTGEVEFPSDARKLVRAALHGPLRLRLNGKWLDLVRSGAGREECGRE